MTSATPEGDIRTWYKAAQCHAETISELRQQLAAQSASDKPAPGEPSKEAMKAAWALWPQSPLVASRASSYARIIDAAFAPKLAELERRLQLQTENVQIAAAKASQALEVDEATPNVASATPEIAPPDPAAESGEDEYADGRNVGQPVARKPPAMALPDFPFETPDPDAIAELRQQIAERDVEIERLRDAMDAIVRAINMRGLK